MRYAIKQVYRPYPGAPRRVRFVDLTNGSIVTDPTNYIILEQSALNLGLRAASGQTNTNTNTNNTTNTNTNTTNNIDLNRNDGFDRGPNYLSNEGPVPGVTTNTETEGTMFHMERTPENNFGWIDSPGIITKGIGLGIAALVPGAAIVEGLAEGARRANNVAAINSMREYYNQPPLDNKFQAFLHPDQYSHIEVTKNGWNYSIDLNAKNTTRLTEDKTSIISPQNFEKQFGAQSQNQAVAQNQEQSQTGLPKIDEGVPFQPREQLYTNLFDDPGFIQKVSEDPNMKSYLDVMGYQYEKPGSVPQGGFVNPYVGTQEALTFENRLNQLASEYRQEQAQGLGQGGTAKGMASPFAGYFGGAGNQQSQLQTKNAVNQNLVNPGIVNFTPPVGQGAATAISRDLNYTPGQGYQPAGVLTNGIQQPQAQVQTNQSVLSGVDATPQEIVNGLVQRGFTKDEASGLVGNMMQEERGYYEKTGKLSVNVENPSSGALGLIGYLGARKDSLLASEFGKQRSVDKYLDFIANERKTDPYESQQWAKAASIYNNLPESQRKPENFASIIDALVVRSGDKVGSQGANYRSLSASQVAQNYTPPEDLVPELGSSLAQLSENQKVAQNLPGRMSPEYVRSEQQQQPQTAGFMSNQAQLARQAQTMPQQQLARQAQFEPVGNPVQPAQTGFATNQPVQPFSNSNWDAAGRFIGNQVNPNAGFMDMRGYVNASPRPTDPLAGIAPRMDRSFLYDNMGTSPMGAGLSKNVTNQSIPQGFVEGVISGYNALKDMSNDPMGGQFINSMRNPENQKRDILSPEIRDRFKMENETINLDNNPVVNPDYISKKDMQDVLDSLTDKYGKDKGRSYFADLISGMAGTSRGVSRNEDPFSYMFSSPSADRISGLTRGGFTGGNDFGGPSYSSGAYAGPAYGRNTGYTGFEGSPELGGQSQQPSNTGSSSNGGGNAGPSGFAGGPASPGGDNPNNSSGGFNAGDWGLSGDWGGWAGF